MPAPQYHRDALANEFTLFCDDIRRVDSWKEVFSQGPAVSALTVKPNERSLHGTIEASQDVLIKGRSGVPDYRMWLFLTSQSWQDDTRLASYWKIWKGLSREGIAWPEALRGPEHAVRAPRRVRYTTTALVTDVEFRDAMTILFQISLDSFILISASDFLSESSVSELFDSAFSVLDDGHHETRVNWGRLIQSRASQDDVIIKRASLFDEFAWSVDIFARPDVLERFWKHDEHTQER